MGSVHEDAASHGVGVPVLEVRHVVKTFSGGRGAGHATSHDAPRAVDDVSFAVAAGESLAVIGESGSGKTTVTRIAFGLLSPDSGDVLFRGESVDATRRHRGVPRPGTLRHGVPRRDVATADARRELRLGSGIVFQDPFASLDPRWRIRRSVAEPLTARGIGRTDALARADGALRSVGLDPMLFGERYPQDLSGGQAQRAAIARALVTRPRILLADEPMSAIDVTSRIQILDTFRAIRAADPSMAMVVVLHDLGIVRQIADRVLVMHNGRIVESGPTRDVLTAPRDPYTRTLIDAATI